MQTLGPHGKVSSRTAGADVDAEKGDREQQAVEQGDREQLTAEPRGTGQERPMQVPLDASGGTAKPTPPATHPPRGARRKNTAQKEDLNLDDEVLATMDADALLALTSSPAAVSPSREAFGNQGVIENDCMVRRPSREGEGMMWST